MYKLKLTARAKHQLKKVSKLYQEKAVNEALAEIKEDPTAGKSLALDLAGLYSYKLGVFRIIYKIDDQNKTILVLRTGHRSTIYK